LSMMALVGPRADDAFAWLLAAIARGNYTPPGRNSLFVVPGVPAR
jgi:hypothetical protein